MRAGHIVRSRLRSLFFRGRREDDLREELQLHIDREAERLQATGLSPGDARLRALRLFGGVEQIKEDCRDARGTAAFDTLVRDTRYAVRRMARDWRFTTAAVLILGIAIGANTAIFSVVNAVLFRKPAYANAERLIDVYQNDKGGRPLFVTSYSAYKAIADYTDVFATTTAASIPNSVRYLHDGALCNGIVEFATATYPDVLGLRPALGRWFTEAEERPGAPVVAVMGHQTWTRTFHADPSLIGRVIPIEGVPVTIVGIGPVNHRGMIDIGVVTDFWLPIPAALAIVDTPNPRRSTKIYIPLIAKARLRDDATVAQAKAAMDVLGRRLAAEPDANGAPEEFVTAAGMTVIPSKDVRVHPQADALLVAIASVVLIIVGLVLAIACTNLATLLLVRGAARTKEIAVRLALGARRHQLIRHLLTESVLLSLGGGVAGSLLAWWAIQALQGVELPITVDLTLDARVLVFATAISLVTGVAFGLAPALKATRVDLLPALRDEGLPPIDHRRLTLKNALIVFQVAVSVLLLGGTSIFVQMLAATRALHVGFAVDGVALLETDFRFGGYPAATARNMADDLLRRIAAVPGVESAALLRSLPMRSNGVRIVVDGAAATSGAGAAASMLPAGPGFFDTLRIPVLYGRAFDARDRVDTPRVAVITETMARRYFGEVNAIGRRFRRESDADAWIQVVGVVRDTGTGNFGDDVLDPIDPPFYLSYTQSDALPTTVVARTSGDVRALVAALPRALRSVDATLPVMTARSMAQDLEESRKGPKTIALFLGVLGGLGLLLASIGLYAVVAFAVERRSREIGIRIALGARSQVVVWNIVRGVAAVLAVGTGLGLLLSVLAMLALRATSAPDTGLGNISFYRPDIDPLALTAIAAVTAAVGVAAAFVPGRRAALMDPLIALRHE